MPSVTVKPDVVSPVTEALKFTANVSGEALAAVAGAVTVAVGIFESLTNAYEA